MKMTRFIPILTSVCLTLPTLSVTAYARKSIITEINNYKTFTKQKKSDIIEEWKE